MGWFKRAIKSWFHNPWEAFLNATVGNVNDAVEHVANATIGQIPGLEKKTQHLFNAVKLPEYNDFRQPLDYFDQSQGGTFGALGIDDNVGKQVVGTALNFVPGVGPWLSAGYNTLNAANDMHQNDSFDWGKFGRTAAVNVGTAAASKALSSWANSAPSGTNTGSYPVAAGNAAGRGLANTSGTIAQGTASFPQMANAAQGINTAAGASSQSVIPTLSKGASSGIMDKFAAHPVKNAVANVGEGLVGDTLSATLLPPQASAIESAQVPSSLFTGGSMADTALSKFGGEELLRPGVAGTPAIGQADIDKAGARITAQDAMARRNLMDQFMSWGRGGDYQDSSAYQDQFKNITDNTQKTRDEYLQNVNTYNNYTNFKATNNLGDEEMRNLVTAVRETPTLSFAPLITPFFSLFP